MVWLTSLLYLRYSRRFSPLKTFRVNGTAFPTCLILEVISTSTENLKRASKQHIFKNSVAVELECIFGSHKEPTPSKPCTFYQTLLYGTYTSSHPTFGIFLGSAYSVFLLVYLRKKRTKRGVCLGISNYYDKIFDLLR